MLELSSQFSRRREQEPVIAGKVRVGSGSSSVPSKFSLSSRMMPISSMRPKWSVQPLYFSGFTTRRNRSASSVTAM